MAALSETDRQILEEFVRGPETLDAALVGLSEAQLDLSQAPGEWSIRQIVHHVADDGDVFSMIAKRAVTMPGSVVTFAEFPGNERWFEGLESDRRPIDEAVALIKAHRASMAELLAHFADKWDNSVTVVDSEGKNPGTISLRQIAQMLTEHMEEHVRTIRMIREKQGM